MLLFNAEGKFLLTPDKKEEFQFGALEETSEEEDDTAQGLFEQYWQAHRLRDKEKEEKKK